MLAEGFRENRCFKDRVDAATRLGLSCGREAMAMRAARRRRAALAQIPWCSRFAGWPIIPRIQEPENESHNATIPNARSRGRLFREGLFRHERKLGPIERKALERVVGERSNQVVKRHGLAW